ncbi:MAG: hypothetical protein EHM43_07755 [Ignavibacteriae bacterium]|nr:MAG: hypothetical protein EHM43_07755 [Ignavibacteriota bacterium]
MALLSDGSYVAGSWRLTVRTEPVSDVAIAADANVAYVDADKIVGELTWRPWHDGDRFVPFGMDGSVLVSDLLTNAKVPFSTRRDIRVVADDEGILWLCGIRPAERTRITRSTVNVRTFTTTNH